MSSEVLANHPSVETMLWGPSAAHSAALASEQKKQNTEVVSQPQHAIQGLASEIGEW